MLGLQRSGTTFLANLLAALPEVAAVEHPDHQGVHESVFFSHFARNFGPWNDPAARQRFLEAFRQSDYFRLSAVDDELLGRLSAAASGYGDLFVRMMDAHALRQGAEAWVEKSPHHTLLADDLLAAAPDAKLLMVERSLEDLLRSRLHGFGRRPEPGLRLRADILRGTLTAMLYRREMRRLARTRGGLLVRYEDLRDDPDGAVRRRILAYLGLAVAPDALRSRYAANSSFETSRDRRAFGGMERGMLGGGRVLGAVLPLAVLKRIHRARVARRGADWPDWGWQQTGYRPGARHVPERGDGR